jgi:putative endopeptidase
VRVTHLSRLLVSVVAAAIVAAPAAQTRPSGLDLTAFDRTVRPQDDLYRFVNGGWIARTELPAERAFYAAYTELADKVDGDLRVIIEDLAKGPARRDGSTAQQIVDMYTSMIDVTRTDELGIAPIQPELDRIGGIKTPRDFARVCGALSAMSTTGPFNLSVATDPARPGELVLHLAQGGTLMGDRNYYIDPDPAMAEIRRKYVVFLETIFTLAGRAGAAEDARAVLALETRLAEAQWSRNDSRDLSRTVNRVALLDLPSMFPGFDWQSWAAPQGLSRVPIVVVAQPSFFKTFASLVSELPIETWKAWLTSRFIAARAPYLSQPFVDARFEIFGRVLVGQQDPRPRWKRGVSMVSTYLGDAIGKLYVERHFPPRARQRVETVVERLVDAYRLAIKSAAWMSSGTRSRALAKLVTLQRKIGYPDRWRHYNGLTIKADDLVGNLQRGQRFENEYRMSRIGQTADRGEWLMGAQAVNAYYSPALNEIVFPAAILQPPFFFPDADDAVNYGAIGAVIGHEIGHAFDERGRLYDAGGQPSGWWTPRDENGYRALVAPLVEQYNEFSPLPGMHVNGALTLNENIGDLGGLAIAFRAYKLSLEGRTSPVIDDLTGEERFFMGWAQLWRSIERDGFMRQTLLIGQHAPSQYRANGPLGHLDAFHETFKLSPGDRLYLDPAKRVRIWQ